MPDLYIKSKPSLCLIFVILLFPAIIFSQIKISGTVTDTTNKPLEFAEVLLMSGEIVAKAGSTNESGNFIIEAAQGNYLLRITYMGRQLYSKQIVLTADLALGNVRVESSTMLEEVVVENKKKLVEKKIDRLVFNMENTISASGGDALDALKLVPRVKVENEILSVVGKNGVSVMINDRLVRLSGEELATFLKSIRADDIKTIEVITNPPAKYSAEGNSGLINIRLKKGRNDAWNAYVQTMYRQNTYATGSFNGGFNYQADKLSLQSGIGYTDGSKMPIERTSIYYPEFLWKDYTERRIFYKPVNGRVSVDYKFSDKVTMGVQYSGVLVRDRSRENVEVTLIDNASQAIDSLINTKRHDRTHNDYSTFNYHVLYTIDTVGTKLALDVDYFDYTSATSSTFATNSYHSDGTIKEGTFVSANNRGNRDIDNFSVNLDMEQPLKWVKLNYGGRVSHTKQKTTFFCITWSRVCR